MEELLQDGKSRKGFVRAPRALALLVAAFALWTWGCGDSAPTEADFAVARGVVLRTLYASSYEDFMRGFTKQRRERMVDTAIWIRWWQEKLEKQRGVWTIVSAQEMGGGGIEVEVQHRRRPTSRQYYRLLRDGGTWGITEIESER